MDRASRIAPEWTRHDVALKQYLDKLHAILKQHHPTQVMQRYETLMQRDGNHTETIVSTASETTLDDDAEHIEL